jgi:glutathione synthase/RimK-type ligase-like ATP-grasp enzyme
MKQLLVIGSKRQDASIHEPLSGIADYVQRMVGDDVVVSHVHVDELVHVLNGNETKVYIAKTMQLMDDFDFVWFRGKLNASLNDVAIVCRYLESKDIKFANPSYSTRAPYGKLAQMYQLARLNLPYPTTISATADFMAAIVKRQLKYPIILKAIHGSHGDNNYLVTDTEHLQELLAKQPAVPFIAQTYVPNQGDYRILIVGNEQLIILRRGSGESHLNNTSKGGNAILIDVADFPAEILKAAYTFAVDSNYDIAGVDVMFGSQDDRPYFLEINSQPQIMSGAFTSEKADLVARYFKQQLEN